jgi:hypothetical protein
MRGKKHGKGVLREPDGTTYEGDFVEDLRQGNGLMTWLDGMKFLGFWRDDF